MRPGECPGLDPGRFLQAGQSCRAAEVHGAFDEPAEQPQAELEIFFMPGDDHRRIRRQGLGVDGGDEQGGRGGVEGRYLAVGPGPQTAPET